MIRPILAAVLGLTLIACGDDGGTGPGTPPPPPGLPPQQTIQFTALPMALADIYAVYPIGNLNPPGHTFPSDHIGLGVEPFTDPVPIYAPSGGYVRTIRRDADDAIEIGPQPDGEPGGERTWYYLGHITLDPTIKVGDLLTAGQRIATGHGMDFGLVDATHINPYIRPERYGTKMLNGVKPLSRFTPALRAQLIPLVTREGIEDEDGKFVYDVPGRLMGNWFHESLPYTREAETNPASWTRHLAFVELADVYGERAIAVGGFTTGEEGTYWVEPGVPDFATVSPSSGKIVYRSVTSFGRWWTVPMQPTRHFLVEMTDPETLRFEMFIGPTAPTAFTAAAATFKR